MKKSNFLIRKCLICKKHSQKKDLIRFYIFNNELKFDEYHDQKYRGFYVCNDKQEIKSFLAKYSTNKKIDFDIIERFK